MWEGARPLDAFGSAVASAGDQNHDGYDDVVVGAQGDDTAGLNAGAAYVYSGRTLPAAAPARRPARAAGSAPSVDHVGARRPDRRLPTPAAACTCSRAGSSAASCSRSHPPPARRASATSSSPSVGRVDGDRVPDLYAADYAAAGGNGWAGVYSGRDGSPIWAWPGGPGDGRGPGREAGDVDHDGRIDLAVGAYTAGPQTPAASTSSPARPAGSCARSRRPRPASNSASTRVGIGDVNRDGEPDLLLSAAEGDTLYLVAGRRRH